MHPTNLCFDKSLLETMDEGGPTSGPLLSFATIRLSRFSSRFILFLSVYTRAIRFAGTTTIDLIRIATAKTSEISTPRPGDDNRSKKLVWHNRTIGLSASRSSPIDLAFERSTGGANCCRPFLWISFFSFFFFLFY